MKKPRTIIIDGQMRTLLGDYPEPGKKLTLLLDHNETAELIFREHCEEEEVPSPKRIRAFFYGWRIPPARLLECPYLLPEDLLGKRVDDPSRYVFAEWSPGAKTTLGETKGCCIWCELLLRPRMQADNAYLYTPESERAAKKKTATARRNGRMGGRFPADDEEDRQKALVDLGRRLHAGGTMSAACKAVIKQYGLSIQPRALEKAYKAKRARRV